MLYHCDNLVHARINIFLMAQAFLFVAFVSTGADPLAKALIAVLGMISTFCYWYAIARMHKVVEVLKEAFADTCPLFNANPALRSHPCLLEVRLPHTRSMTGDGPTSDGCRHTSFLSGLFHLSLSGYG